MFQLPACLQGRRSRNGSDDMPGFPIRQLFVLGKSGTFARIAKYRTATIFTMRFNVHQLERLVADSMIQPLFEFANRLLSCPFSHTSITWSNPSM
jgi:hypothetical protein